MHLLGFYCCFDDVAQRWPEWKKNLLWWCCTKVAKVEEELLPEVGAWLFVAKGVRNVLVITYWIWPIIYEILPNGGKWHHWTARKETWHHNKRNSSTTPELGQSERVILSRKRKVWYSIWMLGSVILFILRGSKLAWQSPLREKANWIDWDWVCMHSLQI